MSLANEVERVREAVAVFDTAHTFQNAIDELLSSGFHRAELSLLASEADVVSKLGHKYRKSSELEDDPSVPRAAYVSTEAIGDGQGAVIGTLMYVGAGRSWDRLPLPAGRLPLWPAQPRWAAEPEG